MSRNIIYVTVNDVTAVASYGRLPERSKSRPESASLIAKLQHMSIMCSSVAMSYTSCLSSGH